VYGDPLHFGRRSPHYVRRRDARQPDRVTGTPDDPPFPPPTLAPDALPTASVPTGTLWTRIHWSHLEPLWFGPATGEPPQSRFDDPDGEYRVCYLGVTVEASFAETFLRNVPVRILSRTRLAARSLARVRVVRPVSLVQLHGQFLTRVGTTAAVASGPYSRSRAWSRALWQHPSRPDGLLYHARHDDETLCVALFDRAADAIRVDHTVPLTAESRLLAMLLERYGVALSA